MNLRLHDREASTAGPVIRRSWAIVPAVLAIVVAACVSAGPGPSAPATGAPPVTPQPTLDVAALDPCSLISSDDLAAIVGADVSVTPGGDVDGRGTCHFGIASSSGAMALDLMIDRAPAKADEGEAFLDQLPQGASADELHGVGDGAWWGYCEICPDGTDTALTVIAAPLRFTLAISGGLAATHQLIGEQVARAIIDAAGL